jgi:hypothetical protein
MIFRKREQQNKHICAKSSNFLHFIFNIWLNHNYFVTHHGLLKLRLVLIIILYRRGCCRLSVVGLEKWKSGMLEKWNV